MLANFCWDGLFMNSYAPSITVSDLRSRCSVTERSQYRFTRVMSVEGENSMMRITTGIVRAYPFSNVSRSQFRRAATLSASTRSALAFFGSTSYKPKIKQTLKLVHLVV